MTPQNVKRLLLSFLLMFCLHGCFQSCSSTEPVVEKPSSLLQWALLKDKRRIVYGVRDVFMSSEDSSESIWKEGQVHFRHLKDSVVGDISFLQYKVMALDNTGKLWGEVDTFWLWQDPVQKQRIHVKGQGPSSMPCFLALKKSNEKVGVAEALGEVAFQQETSNTLEFPFFSVLRATWGDNIGSFQNQNRTLLQDSQYSWNGKQYKVWQVERTLLYQDRSLSKVKLLYGAEGMMYSEQVWEDVRSRNSDGKLLASGVLKRLYSLEYIGD